MMHLLSVRVCLCHRDGFAKIFQQPLDAKKAEKNRLRGIDIASALTTARGTEVRLPSDVSASGVDHVSAPVPVPLA